MRQKILRYVIIVLATAILCSCGSMHRHVRSVPIKTNDTEWQIKKEFNTAGISFFTGVNTPYFYYLTGHGAKLSIYVSNESYKRTYDHIFFIPVEKPDYTLTNLYMICKHEHFALDLYAEEVTNKFKIRSSDILLLLNGEKIYPVGVCSNLRVDIERCCTCSRSMCKASDCEQMTSEDVELKANHCYSIKFDIKNVFQQRNSLLSSL